MLIDKKVTNNCTKLPFINSGRKKNLNQKNENLNFGVHFVCI